VIRPLPTTLRRCELCGYALEFEKRRIRVNRQMRSVVQLPAVLLAYVGTTMNVHVTVPSDHMATFRSPANAIG
jgi:hypothetical protein